LEIENRGVRDTPLWNGVFHSDACRFHSQKQQWATSSLSRCGFFFGSAAWPCIGELAEIFYDFTFRNEGEAAWSK
jgi:hypothetical protein